jgi:hypothetical protein
MRASRCKSAKPTALTIATPHIPTQGSHGTPARTPMSISAPPVPLPSAPPTARASEPTPK